MAIFEARNIHKRFGSSVVLEKIDLSFQAGHVSGIMGPNGAGKTTCFNVLTGRYKPDRGSIYFKDRNITGIKPQRIARMGISRSFQIMSLFDDSTVIENIMIALPGFYRVRNSAVRSVFNNESLVESAMEILEQIGLVELAWQPSQSLSYGNRRALEIGVALAASPQIVFLDEPTQGLGAEATVKLAALINHLRQDYTIIIIEHDMDFLFDLADRISVIHWGQVIAEGSPDELRSNKWVKRSALGEVA